MRGFEPGHTGRLFGDISASGRRALVGFLHVGYPTVEISLAAMRALTGEGDSEGVDLVEVGLPYSDPMMDGVTIQRAGTRAGSGRVTRSPRSPRWRRPARRRWS
jgi:tryptophan synthase alpha chain